MLLLAATANAVAAGPSLAELATERLLLMRDVAAHKWANGLAIEDRAREQRVLESAEAAALRAGAKPEDVRRLFALQIRAAKEIQSYWFERWAAGEAAAVGPDLNTELRPRIVELGDAIVAAAAAHETGAIHLEAIEGLAAATRTELEAALGAVQRYSDRLAQVLDARVLRVGTTGDYAPFSLGEDGGSAFAGIDIDLARDLAESLDARLELVATSWPTLMADLGEGRFDVAMSGVSRTLSRQRVAFFSKPYYVGGKSAISRCADQARFRTLEDIDAPDVRLIVNPGGTNEAFVNARITRAQTRVHDDNRTIFDEIEASRADVMITDAVEVELQAGRRADLCRALPGYLTYQEKGYLLPQDPALKAYVDLWLEQRLGDGSVARTFERHGVPHALNHLREHARADVESGRG